MADSNPKADSLKQYCKDAHKQYDDNCSGAVRLIAQKMGYSLPDVDANHLIDYLGNPKSGWTSVDEDKAQQLADAGELVIAGKSETGTRHGHVVVVYPGGKTATGGYKYPYKDKKSGAVTELVMPTRGQYPRSCSTSMGSWPGAQSDGDKSVWDAWGSDAGYEEVEYFAAPAKSGAAAK